MKYSCPECGCGLLIVLVECFLDNDDGSYIFKDKEITTGCEQVTCTNCQHTGPAMEFGPPELANNKPIEESEEETS